MDRAQLLTDFNSRVDTFEKFQSFIEKAQSQAGKFAAAVVEKVVKDNTERSLEVVGEIIPLMADMENVISELEAEKESAIENAKDSKFQLEELELRKMIGDLTDEQFDGEASDHKEVVDSTDTKIGEIDTDLETFRAAIERWQSAADKAGMGAGEEPAAEEPVVDDNPMIEDVSDIDMGAFEDDGKGDGVRIESVSIADDVSAVFADDDEDEADEDEAGDDEEASDDDGGEGFEVGDLDILGDDEEIELEAGGDSDDDDDDDKPRRAVLLYQEGTAEEQIYPFTGDVMGLGRGRDNDVQVKNDSKVSRYHCKLYRRGPNFYIEDNKSANGTLVNGELITERRLFGGEEVIIGETFFRFRILD